MTNSRTVVREYLIDHVPKLRSIVYRIAKKEGLVDDITQEVCVRIIEKEKLWSGNKKTLSQWMNTIARNLTKDRLIRDKKESKRQEPLGEIVSITDEEMPSEKQVKWLLQQLSALSDRQKQILDMKYYKGMTMVNIGNELGITNQAVSQHVTNAISKLQRKARSQGLLNLLLPWKWNYKAVIDLIVLNRVTEVVALMLFLGGVGFGGYMMLAGNSDNVFVFQESKKSVEKKDESMVKQGVIPLKKNDNDSTKKQVLDKPDESNKASKNKVMINDKIIVYPSGVSISIVDGEVYIDGKLYSDSEIIQGSGTKGTETREMAEFNKLQVSSSVEVNISLGKKFECSVEADDNVIPLILSEVKDNVLYISVKESFSTKTKIKIFIQTPELKKIKHSGSGQITGNVSMVEELIVSGSGDLNITGINSSSLSTMLLGSGDVTLQGGLHNDLNITLSGSGDVNAEKLKVDKADIISKGSGDISLFVNKDISVSIMGSGDVDCYGSPEKEKKKINGTGRFTKH